MKDNPRFRVRQFMPEIIRIAQDWFPDEEIWPSGRDLHIGGNRARARMRQWDTPRPAEFTVTKTGGEHDEFMRDDRFRFLIYGIAAPESQDIDLLNCVCLNQYRRQIPGLFLAHGEGAFLETHGNGQTEFYAIRYLLFNPSIIIRPTYRRPPRQGELF